MIDDRRRCVVCAYALDPKKDRAIMHEACAARLELFDPPPALLERARRPRTVPRPPVPPHRSSS